MPVLMKFNLNMDKEKEKGRSLPMKLLTYYVNGVETVGFASPDGATVWPLSAAGISCTDMQSVVERCTPAELAQAVAAADLPEGILYDRLTHAAPIPAPGRT